MSGDLETVYCTTCETTTVYRALPQHRGRHRTITGDKHKGCQGPWIYLAQAPGMRQDRQPEDGAA